MGGGGRIGKKVLDNELGTVERDMRSANYEQRFGDNSFPRLSKCFGSSDEIIGALVAAEHKRIDDGLVPSALEPGEMLMVDHVEVRCLWNRAMQVFDLIESMGYEVTVYGECGGWDSVEDFLLSPDVVELEEGRSVLAFRESSTSAWRGLKNIRGRDKGRRQCSHCLEHSEKLKQCAGCRKVEYCSKACQRASWKAGHRELCAHMRVE